MSPPPPNDLASPAAAAWHALEPGATLRVVGSSEQGLAAGEAATRLARHGPNVLEQERGPGPLLLLWRQLESPIVWLLLGSAALAVVLGKVLDGSVVLGAVLVNAAIGFLQEFRAGKAFEALSRMVPLGAQVVRDGVVTTVPSAELVPGDVVQLASGDRVPADARLLTIRNLQVDEAALTGESVPAQKALPVVAEDSVVGDRRCMVFSGTLVTSGTGRAVVVSTGAATELGRISRTLQEATELQTPLTRAIASVGKKLTVAVLIVSAILLAASLLRGYALADAIMVAITMAVATIPEGLPAIITIALAVGVQRMAARRAVVRKLPSVETLGSTTVICSDKTGTLTRNEMTVQALRTPSGGYLLSGVGYAPTGGLSGAAGPLVEPPEDVHALLAAGALCNDAVVHRQGDGWALSGDPTEGALVVSAAKVGIDVDALRRARPRLDAIPFESEHQFMATLHAGGGATPEVFVKGAPEVVLRRCGLDEAAARGWMTEVAALASQGMRVLALAHKRLGAAATGLTAADAEGGLALLGLQGMIDPPRPEAIEAVRACHGAGITVKMITGDHLGTAEAIGRRLGLLAPDARGMAGAALAQLDDEGLRQAAAATNVFARVAPEHKLRLVKALQAEGHVVAMTGDGVNDAPALKQANVGVAMGITGTAVSKEASDVVLADDNFATIAAAVEEGRRIYDNLTKSLAFVLPANLGLGLILVAAVAFFPLVPGAEGALVPLQPMLPTQLLWINLVSSVALSLPLAFEIREADAMRRPPRPPGAPILDRFVLGRTALVAVLVAAGALALFYWEYSSEVALRGHETALREAQTMAVTAVVLFQALYLFHCRSLKGSALELGIFSNKTVFLGVGALLALQAAFVYVPPLQRVFGTAPLAFGDLGVAALVALVIVPVIATEKALRRRRAGGRDPLTRTPAARPR